MIKRLIGALASLLTPNTIYTPRRWRIETGEQLTRHAAQRGSRATKMTVAATAMVCAIHDELPEETEAVVYLEDVTDAGRAVGSYEVVIRRVG